MAIVDKLCVYAKGKTKPTDCAKRLYINFYNQIPTTTGEEIKCLLEVEDCSDDYSGWKLWTMNKEFSTELLGLWTMNKEFRTELCEYANEQTKLTDEQRRLVDLIYTCRDLHSKKKKV